jgi:predicted metalloprotease with PDZ domain
VLWESSAFDAGLSTGDKIAAVHGRTYKPEELTQAVVAAELGQPIELWVSHGKGQYGATIDFRGGPLHPHLEPITGARNRLAEILAPRS